MLHRNAVALVLTALGVACIADDPLTVPERDHEVVGLQSRSTLAPLYGLATGAVQGRPDHYIVKLNDDLVSKDSTYIATEGILANTSAVSQKTWSTFRGFYARIQEDDLERLRQHPLVEYIEADRDFEADGSGTQSSAPWHLDRIDQNSYPLDGDYTYNASGSGVRIYVVDSGVRTSHDDFGNRATNPYQAENWIPANTDCLGHGTAVASAAAGSEWGSAKDARIIGVRVNDCTSTTPISNIIDGMEWVTNNRIRPAVVNISYSPENSPAAEDAAEDLIDAGVIVVTSAGNTSEPACNAAEMHSVRSVIVVGAMRNGSDTRVYFSNYGSCVDLYAPGEDITMAGIDDDSDTVTQNGTSFSSPLTAGAAAQYLELYPNDSPNRVHEVLRLGATYASSNASPFLYVNQPRIKRVSWSGPSTVSTTDECSWRANVVGGRSPFTYAWSGVLSGSGSEIIGRVTSTGILTLNVTGRNGQSASYQNWVHVGSSANCPDE